MRRSLFDFDPLRPSGRVGLVGPSHLRQFIENGRDGTKAFHAGHGQVIGKALAGATQRFEGLGFGHFFFRVGTGPKLTRRVPLSSLARVT